MEYQTHKRYIAAITIFCDMHICLTSRLPQATFIGESVYITFPEQMNCILDRILIHIDLHVSGTCTLMSSVWQKSYNTCALSVFKSPCLMAGIPVWLRGVDACCSLHVCKSCLCKQTCKPLGSLDGQANGCTSVGMHILQWIERASTAPPSWVCTRSGALTALLNSCRKGGRGDGAVMLESRPSFDGAGVMGHVLLSDADS